MDIRHSENYMLITRTECLAAEGADSCGKGEKVRPRRHKEAQRPPRGKQPTAAKRHGPFLPPSLSIKKRGNERGYIAIKNSNMTITRTECLAAEGADSCGKGGAVRPRRHEEAQHPPRGKQPTAAERHGPS